MTADEAISKAAIPYLPSTYKRILIKLGEEPSDSASIAEHLGMTLNSAYKLIMMLKALKVVCVVEYRRRHEKGARIKVWGLGSKDVRPPPKVDPAARSKAWRDRHRVVKPKPKSPEGWWLQEQERKR